MDYPRKLEYFLFKEDLLGLYQSSLAFWTSNFLEFEYLGVNITSLVEVRTNTDWNFIKN